MNKNLLSIVVAFFMCTIAQGQITIAAPNGGEIWVPGTQHTISWYNLTGFGTPPRIIFYSSDNGTTWIPIDTVPGSTASYSWTVPNVNSNQCLVRVQESATAYDDSNGAFTISASAGVVENGNDSKIIVYPNPVMEYMTIKNNSLENPIVQVSVIDLQGKLVETNKCEMPDQQIKIDMSVFAPGIYSLVIDQLHSTARKKIVIQ